MWIYSGIWPPPKSLAHKKSLATAEHLYVLAFPTRTKIGVSLAVGQRLANLVWEHEKLAGEKPQRVAVTLQTPWARQIEKQVLDGLSATRLSGEYFTAPFSRVEELVTAIWKMRTEQASATQLVTGRRLPEQPRLYRLNRPVPMWLVQWAGARLAGRSGRTKRTRKCFVQENEARDYLAVVTDLWRARLLDRQQDADQALALLNGTDMTLTQLARDYLKGRR